MEPTPSTSRPFKTFDSPRKKRKSGHFSENEKLLIINVYKNVKQNFPKVEYQSKNDMKDKTADILGISKSAVYRILKEYTITNTVKPAMKPKKRPSVIDKTDNFDMSCIRRIVHNFYFNGQLPTTQKVLHAIHSNESLPNLGLTSLQKILKHLKFKYIKRRGNTALIDKNDIALWRLKYLKDIKAYRQQERPIYYLDETWVNTGQSRNQATLDGLSTEAKNQISTENRLIVLHIGGKEGFVPDSELIFECKVTGDYHESMNAAKFESWFQNVLPRLEPEAVVIMDNAKHHSRRQEKIPMTGWRKTDIQQWLSSKNISFEEIETKVTLLERVRMVKKDYESFVIDDMARAVGVEVLRLPPYHWQLNAIEIIWTDVKGYVARNNKTFKMADVRALLKEGLQNVTAEKWQNCIDYVKKEEIKLDNLDNLIDDTIDSFIINVTGEISDSSSDTELESDSN